MQWFKMALQKYAVFSGRSQRSEYWFFVLFYMLIAIAIAAVEGLIGTGGVLGMVYMLGMLIPSISVGVRRLHDTNRTGWWMLIALIPLIGAIVLIIFFCIDSDEEENRFGPNPKAAV